MNIIEAFKILNIEEYSSAIMTSNSHGELFHLNDYIILATFFKEINNEEVPQLFKEWFTIIVKHAEDTWERPNSIYQHILSLFKESFFN